MPSSGQLEGDPAIEDKTIKSASFVHPSTKERVMVLLAMRSTHPAQQERILQSGRYP